MTPPEGAGLLNDTTPVVAVAPVRLVEYVLKLLRLGVLAKAAKLFNDRHIKAKHSMLNRVSKWGGG